MSAPIGSFSLDGSPYTIEATGQHVVDDARELQERADLLRKRGSLTEATLRDYFGDKRYEQIAESNAIEGSPLSVGETELAVEKGITITGHDPSYSADAVNLSAALELPAVDRWIAHLPNDDVTRLEPSEVARRVQEAVFASLTSD